MFTGIVTDVGRVVSCDRGLLSISTRFDAIAVGASMACDGCCLTVTAVEPAAKSQGTVFLTDVSNETLAKTTIAQWSPGRRVNLERAATPASELAGHFVTGHIDGVGRIVGIEPDGSSRRFTIDAPDRLAKFLAPKGSIALDGISLTLNAAEGRRFGVNLIPHTLKATTWGEKEAGDGVNIEVDLIARYIARLMEVRS